MKKRIYILLFIFGILLSESATAHDLGKDILPASEWHLKDGTQFKGWFLKSTAKVFYFDCGNGQIRRVPEHDLLPKDLGKITPQLHTIDLINKQQTQNPKDRTTSLPALFMVLLAGFIFLLKFRSIKPMHRIYIIPVALGGSMMFFSAFTMQIMQKQSAVSLLDSAFAPFVPQVHTYTDNIYYHVESRGIPETHEMMVGISDHGWQQQLPIPQCYLGSNSWSIPLHPVPAVSPIPVDSIHFTRGAIALAVNGVPIFNVHTNTGVDSYLDGQLDNFGGHCGRADDYHYHTAPLHLYKYTQQTLPIAWGLDGYPVYGALEPDGSAMKVLDKNHGHIWGSGDYHYHGTSAAPYMIAAMYGQVTEDNTHQLIPQPAAKPIRPALTPLKGALITACRPRPLKNGYTLLYTLNGATDSIDFFWDQSGNYTYNFYHLGVLTAQNYKGFTPCTVPYNGINAIETQSLSVFPVPAFSDIFIQVSNELKKATQKMVLVNSEGQITWELDGFSERIERKNWSPGIYILTLYTPNYHKNIKIILE